MKETSLIIFDLDGTLYDLNDVMSMSYQMQVDFFSSETGKTAEETKAFFATKDVMPQVSKTSKSATELFQQMGIGKQKWSEYREKHFDVNRIDISKAVPTATIEKFKAICDIVLVSSNAYQIIEGILHRIGIAPKDFDDIVCSDRFPYSVPFKKKMAFEYLSQKYSVDCGSMLSIGDRYLTDILPMIELGGHGILLHHPKALENVARDVMSKSIHSSAEDGYEYF